MTTQPAVPAFADYYLASERERLNNELETATTIGDAAKVKAIAGKLVELEKRASAAPAAPGAAGAGKPAEGAQQVAGQQQGANGATWTVDQARAAIEKQAPWFGSDPEMTKAAFETANFINTRKYKSAEEYAKAIQAAVEKKFDVEPEEGGDDDEPPADGEAAEGEGEATETDEGEPARKPAVRRASPGAGGAGASRVSGARNNAVPTKLSQIPDVEVRKKLAGMVTRQKLDEKTVVKNWYDQEQRKKKNAKTGAR